MAGNAEIAVVLKLVADQFSRELRKQEGSLGKFVGSINRSKILIAAISGAVLGLAKSAADYGDHLAKTSQKVGMSVQALAALEHAAKLADVSQEELSVGLIKLSRNASDTAKGTGESVAAFAALGISVQDTSGKLKSSDVLFGEIAERFSRMEDGAGKTALAVQLFGKSGAGLIPLLNAGKQGLAEAADEAKRFGLILSEDQAKASEKFNDDLTRLQASSRGLAMSVGKELIPPINELVNLLTALASGPIGAGITTFFKSMVLGVHELGLGIAALGAEWAAAFEHPADWAAGNDAHMARLKEIRAAKEKDLNDLAGRLNGVDTSSNLSDSAKSRFGKGEIKKEVAPNLATGEEAKSVEKLSKALVDQVKVRAELVKATLDHQRAIQEEKRSVEDTVLAMQAVSGQSEEVTLRKELEVKQRRLAEDKAFHEQRLKLLDESTRRQISIIQGSAQEQAAHLIRAGKIDEARQVIEESKRKVEQLREENRVNKEGEKADIDRIAVKQSLIQTEGALKAASLDRARAVATAEANLAAVEQQSAIQRQGLELSHREGKLDDIELLRSQIQLERELREARIAAAQATVSRATPGSADAIGAQGTLDRLVAENAAKNAQESRQLVQTTKEYEIAKHREASQMELEIAELQYASEQEIAQKKIAVLEDEMNQRLLTVKAGSEEEARIRKYYGAKQKDVADEANGSFFDGWQRGLKGYVRDTKGALGMGVDMARQTAQAMTSGFQTFFFDVMKGKVTSLKDIFKGVLNFAQQMMSQIAAQMATQGIMKALAGAGGGGSGFNWGSLFSGFGFNKGGVAPEVQYFASGGVPSLTNGDSVRAMLTPGERILTREQNAEVMDLIRQGAGGGNGKVSVNIINNTGMPLPEPQVNITRDTVKGWVYDIAFEHRRTTGRGL